MTKKGLITFGILLTISLSLVMTISLYAFPNSEDNCLSCHTNEVITVTSNVTDTLEVNASGSFGIEINAEGDAGGLTTKWPSTINPLFTFTPSTITDNSDDDNDPAENTVNGIFEITAPATQGEYIIQVFAAGSGGKGGALTFQVTVETEGLPTENLLPTAYFLHTRRSMTIEFEDRSWDTDDNIASWHWDFGDGSSSNSTSPIHTFAESGTYTVTLTVTDDQGGSNTKSQIFAVPSKGERLLLWTLEIFIGSIIIVFTTLFAVGIARARYSKERNKSE